MKDWKTIGDSLLKTVAVAGLALVAIVNTWRAQPAPTPTPTPTPQPVVTIDPARSYVTRNGVTLDDAEATKVVAVVGLGDGAYSLVSYPVGAKPITKTLIIGEVQPIPPGPTPPKPPEPEPKPLPAGFAGEVASKAKGLPASDCIRLADNYRAVASMIAAGGLTKIDDVPPKLEAMNKSLGLDKSKWSEFGNWIGGEANKRAQTLPTAQAFLSDVATGLEYAGGK